MLDRFSSVVAPALNPAAIGRAPAVQFGISVGHAFEWALRGRDWDLPGVEKLPEDIARQIRRDFRQRMEIRIELIKQVFAVVCGQPLDINREFFRGVSVGMQRRVISPQGGFTGDGGRTDVYISFLQFSGFIGTLGTMRELHEWLCALLGPNRAGRDIDRLKKLCGDIGLNFRDGQPGRPRKIGEAAGV